MRSVSLGLIFSLSATGVAALLIVIGATPWGIGLSPDSAIYIGGARSLHRGGSFSLPGNLGTFAPIVHFPPLYSAVLAALAVLGADPLQGASWLSASLFACNCVLAGLLSFVVLRSTFVALLVSLFVLTAFPMVQAHTMAWSEPLFLSLQLGGMLVFLSYLRERNRQDLIVTSIVLGFGVLTRYAGIAMLAAGSGAVLMLNSREQRERISDVIVFTIIGLLPLLVWLVRNEWVADRLVNRAFFFHPISGERITSVIHVVSSWLSFAWLTSFDVLSASLTVLTVSVAAGLFFEMRLGALAQLPRDSYHLSVKFLLIVTCSYLTTLLGSISFLDAQIPIDSRLLSPLYVPLLVLGLSFLTGLWRSSRFTTVSRAVIALGLALALAAQTAASINWLEFSYRNGVGYAGRQWRNSETLAKLASLPAASSVYSNAPDVLYILRGTSAAMIPRKVDPQTAQPNLQYAAEMVQLKRALNENGAMLVFFNRITWRGYLPTAAEIQDATGIRPFAQERDGVIYVANLKQP